MTIFALLAIGSLALWMVVAIVGAQLVRRRRRRDMGLPQEPKPWQRQFRGLPRREKNWRDDPSVRWTDARYYGGARRRLQEKERRP